jgi:site-specific recombinase XerD
VETANLKSDGRRVSLEPGALQPIVQIYAEHLSDLCYCLSQIKRLIICARHFCAWLNRSSIALDDVDDRVVEQFAQHRCECRDNRRPGRPSPRTIFRTRRFVRFLSENGLICKSTSITAEEKDRRLIEFEEWLRNHRGITDRTIRGHIYVLSRRLLPALGSDPARYDAGLVRQIILDGARQYSPTYIKRVAMVLRQYLQFLAARGDCRPWLERAIPTMVRWRAATLPRYLLPADVERVIAACDPAMPGGVRDRAILLLLARLGLRAGDILDMRLDDVEWQQATLRVRGKGRREVRLPLPQDAGNALLRYLKTRRPRVVCDRVFLRSEAPYLPFTESGAISKIVRRALTRAGITSAPSQGAHLLRHSAATAMLRSGATLDAIGTVLRHRSIETTAHYAKVDIPALHQIAQAWPGDASC